MNRRIKIHVAAVFIICSSLLGYEGSYAQIYPGWNDISGDDSGVAGGETNKVSGDYCLIGAGQFNTNSGPWSFIGAGIGNVTRSSGAFIGSGEVNSITGVPDLVDLQDSAIVGGWGNSILGSYWSFIGGGYQNTVGNLFAKYSVIGGGEYNLIQTNNAVIAGGQWNAIIAGDYSAIAGGYYNTNNAPYGFIGGGSHNLATGAFSAIAGGAEAQARLYCQVAHASGGFEGGGLGNGEAQASEYILRITTTTTNETELFLDGDTGTQRVLIPSNGTWTFEVQVTVRNASGGSGGFKAEGVIQTVSGTTSLNGVVGGQMSATSIYQVSPSLGVTVSADDTHDALAIKVHGASATTRWVATVRTTEVKY